MKFFKRKKVTETKNVVSETRCDYCFENIKDNKKVELIMRAGYGSTFDTIENDVLFDLCDSCFAGTFGGIYQQKQEFDMTQPGNYEEAKRVFDKLCRSAK